MSIKPMSHALVLAALLLNPPTAVAQPLSPVSINPASPPVSYAAWQPQTPTTAPGQDPLASMSRVRSRRQDGAYTAPPQSFKGRTATLNNLLLRHQPLRIGADQVRRAAQAKAMGKAPFRPDNDHKHLIVNVVYNSLDETKQNGLFALDIETGELTCLFSGFEEYDNYGFNGGAYIWNGKYRGVYYEQGTTVDSTNPAYVMDFDMNDWTFDEDTYINGTIPYQTSMAIECATEYNADGTTSVVGQFWGVDKDGNLSLRYATLDSNGRTTTKFGKSATKHMLAMGVTSDGRLYGVAKDGNLYRIDRATGDEILIGHTGISDLVDYEGHFWLQGGEIDPKDNTFYWAAEHASVEHTQLCSVDLATGQATVLVDFMGDVECAGIVVAPQQRQDGTPAAASNLTATFAPLQLTGSGTFTAPSTSFNGQPLAAGTPLYYHVYVNDVAQTLADNQTTAGAEVTFDIASTNVKNNAENSIRVTMSLSADGEQSVSATTTAWVGYGIPEAPGNVAMSLDEATGVITISWEHPTRGDYAGVRGGVIDNVSYFVYRVVDGERMGDITNGYPIMDDVTSATYTLTDEDRAMTLGELSFDVVACSSLWGFPLIELTSDAASTSAITIGVGKSIPYFVDFANDYYNIRQKDFTIIDGNGDGKTWGWCEPHLLLGQQLSGAVATNNYTTTLQNDEWLITPGIALEAGKSYHFKSNMHGPKGSSYTEIVEVCLGTDKTKAAMTETILTASTVIDYCMKEGDFTVPADGNYYIGLHAVSAPNQWEIAVFDISVTDNAGTLEDQHSPKAGELAVSPAYGVTESTDAGGNTVYCGAAKFDITLPTVQQNNMPLTNRLLNVTLTATLDGETQTLQEWSDQTPGATLSYDAANLPSGEYTFALYAAYTQGGFSYRSPAAVATAYVGWDNKPARPDDAQVVQSGDKLLVRFTPDAQPKGAHGAYLPSVTYRAYSYSKAGQLEYYSQGGQTYVYDMITPDAETTGTELQIPDFNPSEGQQYNFNYTVLAVSTDAKGNKIYSDFQKISAVIGAPEPAPKFETGDQTFILDATLSPELDETSNYWSTRGQQVVGVVPIEDQFGFDVGKSWYLFSAFNGEVTAVFGKVDISTLDNPTFNLDIILEDTDTDMDIILNGPDGLQATHRLTVMDGQQHISIPLSQYQSWGWVQPELKGIFHLTVDGDRYHDIYFDNVGVYDAQPQNLAVTNFEVPAQLNSGQEAIANVTVMNMGQQDVKGYTVNLTEDDIVVQSKTVNNTLRPGEIDVVQFRYMANTVTAFDATGMEDAEKVLVATLESEGDGIESDNSAEAVVTITVQGGKQNSHPEAVAAQQAEGSAAVSVSWTFDFEQSSQQVTESFEDYELWYTGGVKAGAPEGQLGPWRLYDGDGKPTYTWQYMEMITEYAGEPQAFQVFNGDIFSGMSDYYYYDMTPVSGQQYLVSMDPADGNYTPMPDDWLISPAVRGGSTLEFYYGALLRQPQGCEVYYSETGRDISDFKLLKSFEPATGDDWYLGYIKLPETAKYFAIRHSSASYMGYGLKLDDITYSRLTGIDHFNIYVDGILAGTSSEANYTIDGGLQEGSHRVAVTAVFADGTESIPAYADIDYTTVGIREVMAAGKPVDVYTVDGRLARRQTRTTAGLKGVYVVNGQNVILK